MARFVGYSSFSFSFFLFFFFGVFLSFASTNGVMVNGATVFGMGRTGAAGGFVVGGGGGRAPAPVRTLWRAAAARRPAASGCHCVGLYTNRRLCVTECHLRHPCNNNNNNNNNNKRKHMPKSVGSLTFFSLPPPPLLHPMWNLNGLC